MSYLCLTLNGFVKTTDMRKTLSTIILTTACIMVAGCKGSEQKDEKQGKPETEQAFTSEAEPEYTELKKVPLPCDKEKLYYAWKQIGVIELQRKKTIDYRQNTASLYISTDLDEDGNPEIILRGEPPYAAIYTFLKDTLNLITFVDQPQMGLAITQDGVIIRNGIGANGSTISEFIRLKNSQKDASGAIREKFEIKNNEMVSVGTEYVLWKDSAMVKVTKAEYLEAAPQGEGSFLEDIDGWEDFRKP